MSGKIPKNFNFLRKTQQIFHMIGINGIVEVSSHFMEKNDKSYVIYYFALEYNVNIAQCIFIDEHIIR